MSGGKRGLLFVISGPAGSGKSTINKKLVESGKFEFSVSATTRKPRAGEIDGVHYHFISREDFEKKIAAGEMLEYAEYVGNFYGTPRAAVESCLDAGKNIILEIEVQGAAQVKEKMPEAVMVLILPPDAKTLEERLRGRGTETDEIIRRRMEASKYELEYFSNYDYIVINGHGQSDEAAELILSIEKAEKARTFRNTEIKENFYN
mgnify:CR=1 FL=1